MHFIGLDVHKKTIAYCAKTAAGTIVDEGTIQALRPELEAWAAARPAPWKGTLEATMFSGWIYDTLKPHAVDLAVAHPASLEAITRAKKKSDKLDGRKLSDLTRANLVPRVWMPPRQQRELRRLLRFRNRLVQQAVWNKNRIATLLMELGEPYTKSKLHTKRYFERFGKIDEAVSYCGLCSRLNESAGKSRRGPLSKQRNGHLQHVLIEAAKLAPRWNDQLARLHADEVARGHRNQATVALARKLAALLLAVERRGTGYEKRE